MSIRFILGSFLSVFILFGVAIGDTGSATQTTSTTRDSGWSDVIKGYRIRLSADKDSYTALSRIAIIIGLDNTGPEKVDIATRLPMRYYINKIEIVLPDGKTKAPLTLYGSELANIRIGGGMSSSLDPGQMIAVTIPNLNRMYDLTLSGKYTIVVHYPVPDRQDKDKMVDLVSKPIVIEITN